MDSANDSARSKASTDDDVQSISRSSRGQSEDQGETIPGYEDAVGLETHRNMMLASLLEDYYRSRALEFLNATNPGQIYTRQSQEVEAIATRLFGEASSILTSNGLLSPRATSNASRGIRQQYLSGLDGLVAGTQPVNILDSMHDLVAQASLLNITTPPTNDLQLTLRNPPAPPHRSHYKASFREDRLLGRGGFGKVYQCFSVLDQQTYAVKKIALPRKLVKSFSDGRHDDLADVLREVKAMAVLDHPNIVRYHATWVEEPQHSPEPLGGLERTMSGIQNRRQQLLLDSHAFSQDSEQLSVSGGIVFGEDTRSSPSALANNCSLYPVNRGWSEDVSSGLGVDSTLASESNVFAGDSDSEDSSSCQANLDTNVPALYIQMSMYPMTLAQYLSPSSCSKAGLRHCFHLAPTLRLALSIHDGLQHIHSKGLIHRDIKPGNIFLSSVVATFEGGCCDISCESCKELATEPRWLNPRIGDFGLVHQLAQGEVPSQSQSPSDHKHDAGTTYYQPPRKGERKDEKIDIFALGVVFVEMLCRCTTAMERVDMLKGLQRGEIPSVLRQNIQYEGHDEETAEKIVQLVSGMIDEDSAKRWCGTRVREALEELLQRC
ncbi:kinase-like domain-containing protein [Xylaria bambusicola]|uniref:kinase-like domain-containing protein n=1 Tax=Xylaria bambusicola TaxID=326684 RepID=UPI00200899FA|nr:kinase-like domain-containing protein [Xylaria bambusicola]KAI0528307.1 kinase-like domain-containing protein [Xylaria bambusicola]